jgi:hypothetical protein
MIVYLDYQFGTYIVKHILLYTTLKGCSWLLPGLYL